MNREILNNLPHPNAGLADYDPPISAGSTDDGDKQSASGLPYLALVDRDRRHLRW